MLRELMKTKRIIIKIGSSSIVKKDLSVNEEMMNNLMKEIAVLRNQGIEVLIVSSGAIALGMHSLGLAKKPKEMALKQACAAIGQAKLMEYYNHFASKFGVVCGQILLNHDDFEIRKRMLHLSDTLDSMFKCGVIPIINENDALAVEEIRVGDNDTLASFLVPMISANLIILFSDIDGLYTKNPKLYSDASKVEVVYKIDKTIYDMVGINPSNVGTGGMETKLNAAIIATNANCDMIICNANELKNIAKIIDGDNIGTLFKAKSGMISSRDHWMIFKARSHGNVVIDLGLEKALLEKKVSILPKGIVAVEGNFLGGAIINIKTIDGRIIAKGISNYSSIEIDNAKGLETDMAMKKNNNNKKEIIHANNLVILREELLC